MGVSLADKVELEAHKISSSSTNFAEPSCPEALITTYKKC